MFLVEKMAENNDKAKRAEHFGQCHTQLRGAAVASAPHFYIVIISYSVHVVWVLVSAYIIGLVYPSPHVRPMYRNKFQRLKILHILVIIINKVDSYIHARTPRARVKDSFHARASKTFPSY